MAAPGPVAPFAEKRSMPVAFLAALLIVSSPAELDRFAGRWDLHGQLRSKMGTRSFTVREDCHWSSRRTFMICEVGGSKSGASNVTLMWRDQQAALYRFSSLSLDGTTSTGTIQITPVRWTWDSADARRRYRTVNRWISPFRIEYASTQSRDGGKTWVSTGHGTEVRK